MKIKKNRKESIQIKGGSGFLLWAVACLFLALSGCGREESLELVEGPGETFALSEQIDDAVDVAEAEPEPASIWVDICGAVNRPGVYELEEGSRLYQVIEAAEGLREDACGDSVNQARVVADGEQIRVYTQEEYQQAGAIPVPEMEASGGKVNLNTASEEELQELSGIGPSKAAAIAAYRETHGGFKSPEEIREVDGIGEGTYDKIKDDIVVF